MSWLRSHQRSAWIIGLTLLLPALLYVDALFGLVGMRQEYQSDIDRLTPRIARLQGLIEHEEQLRASTAAIGQQVVNLVYPAADDRTTVSARLQKDVRQILVDAGLSVTNSQVLPVRERDVFDYIGLKVSVTGDIASLDMALSAVASYRPVVLVESLDVWPKRQSRRGAGGDDQTVTASLQLLSLRAAQ